MRSWPLSVQGELFHGPKPGQNSSASDTGIGIAVADREEGGSTPGPRSLKQGTLPTDCRSSLA